MELERKIRTIIIDDELPARKLLADYVSKVPTLELAAVCEDAVSALTTLQVEDIDLVLSDIQMPDLTGLDLVRSLKGQQMVVFTTAYSEYALESYNLEAVDYLLKPISFPRFMQAIGKATEKFKMRQKIDKTSEQSEVIKHIITTSSTDVAEKDYFMVKADHKLYRVRYEDIIFIEGQSEYVTFHLADKRNITAYYSLKKLEDELPSNIFVRIHKSYIVSISYVIAVEGMMLNVDGRRLSIGKLYKDELLRVLCGEPKREGVEYEEV